MPFNIETAKKITNKEVEGRIVTRNGQNARILCFDRKGTALPIIALVEIKCGVEDFFSFYVNGRYDSYENNGKDLVLEIPEYMTFKDGDVIAYDKFDTISITMADVKCEGKDVFAHYYVELRNGILKFNEVHVRDILSVGARIATESEKQQLIGALKASKEPKAKEYLKRFFGIEQMQEYKFKPFDKVLVKDDDENSAWSCNLFSGENEDGTYMCIGGYWDMCIPYNESTAHLLGTTEDFKP